jgi:macrolide-specific efflux system membrane fusion protein
MGLVLAFWVAAAGSGATEIEVFIRLIEQVEVPAREAGELAEVRAKEGQIVRQGEVLAQIEDVEARFARQRAEFETHAAREQAEDDVVVRAAEKGAAVAQTDWQRALRTNAKNPNAISASEVEHLQLTAEKAELDVERAKRDLRVAKINLELKENELEYSRQRLERHKVVAPLDGMVVEMNRRRGEWVEPGEKVLRIVRIDRLRAEGYVDARQARAGWVGMPVVVRVEVGDPAPAGLPGKVVFVSPEIDPVNGQVAVWAEVENPDLRLRPGLRASMELAPAAPAGAERNQAPLR